MALVAYDLYFRCSHLERGQRHGDLAGEELKKARARLDDVYVAQRVAMGAIWSRLDLHFGSANEPSRTWHRVIDLLTVQYFHVAGFGADRLGELTARVAGADHTELAVEELGNIATAQAAFEGALLDSTSAVQVAAFESAVARPAH